MRSCLSNFLRWQKFKLDQNPDNSRALPSSYEVPVLKLNQPIANDKIQTFQQQPLLCLQYHPSQSDLLPQIRLLAPTSRLLSLRVRLCLPREADVSLSNC